MALKRKDGEAAVDNKRRKRVGFATIDPGIEANECIKVFLVDCEEDVDAVGIICIDLVDLNQFFGEDGKIYGYTDLKINIWVSKISFHAYADITFQSTSDAGRGITDLKPPLQKIFGESLVDKKEFLKAFSAESHYIRNVVSNGAVIHLDAAVDHDDTSNTCLDADGSTIEVMRMNLNSMPVGLLYSRLVPLVLLLIEGSRPVDITDPRWQIYIVVKKIPDQSRDVAFRLIGFATAYCFYHYPDSTRLRISQILVLPPFQGHGYGRRLLESVNSVAIAENVYDVTVEEPSDHLQYLRGCIDTSRLLVFEPIRSAITSVASHLKQGNLSKRTSKFQSDPPAGVVEIVREKLKINKKQFLKCWEVLIYLYLDPEDIRFMENFRACVYDRVKSDVLDKDAGTDGKRLVEVPNDDNQDLNFVVFRSQVHGEPDGLDGNVGDETTQKEQLNELVDLQIEEITEIAKKVRI